MKWIPVYRDTLENVSLLMSFLEGDQIPVKIVADVGSSPLQGPAAHNVKSQYSEHVLLAPEDQAERAAELIRYFQENQGGDAPE